ncbi:MAG: hypothetical protein C4519_03415 [Desulfobacteraceae bacterium]|nr:MAG: hypothetical protein C4519_03415 [Desulfobacteraceae bacterium]
MGPALPAKQAGSRPSFLPANVFHAPDASARYCIANRCILLRPASPQKKPPDKIIRSAVRAVPSFKMVKATKMVTSHRYQPMPAECI